ncbi:Pre-mRNA-splicing factor SLU7 [Yarrowia sp. B02]|nr:Pre-mRNA-splicing factor SLU7 [Yarrowia sp. B02]
MSKPATTLDGLRDGSAELAKRLSAKRDAEGELKHEEDRKLRKEGKVQTPVTNQEGDVLNPYIPRFMSSAPWYAKSDESSLDHLKKDKVEKKEEGWYQRGQRSVEKPTKFRKGACENCGAMTHKRKECMERPRKIGAKYRAEDLQADDIIANPHMSWDSKRDRWNGYDADDFKRVIEEHEMTEALAKEMQPEVQTDAEKASEVEEAIRKSTRSLRLREDTAVYLKDLSSETVYNPGSRTFRTAEEGYIDKDGMFVRHTTGEGKEMEELVKIAEAESAQGNQIHLHANPTAAAMAARKIKEEAERKKEEEKRKLEEKYGSQAEVRERPKEFVSVSKPKKPVVVRAKNAQGIAVSKYEEDVFPGNHTAIWGSWYDKEEKKWGYGCCHCTVKNGYCVGEKGKKFFSSGLFFKTLSQDVLPDAQTSIQIPRFEGVGNYNPTEEEKQQAKHEKAVSQTIIVLASLVGIYFGYKWYGPYSESDEELHRQVAERQKRKRDEKNARVKQEEVDVKKQAVLNAAADVDSTSDKTDYTSATTSDNTDSTTTSSTAKSSIPGVSFASMTAGLFAWGDNSGHAIKDTYNVDSETPKLVRSPVRIRFFEGKLLRDVSLGDGSGAAILDNGDVVQWGDKFAAHSVKNPEVTLSGKDAVRIVQSRNMLYALSRDGQVYSFPVSKDLQIAGPKEKENRTRLIPGWKRDAKITYRVLDFDTTLGLTEKLADIQAGADHLLALSNKGRVFVSSTGGAITETQVDLASSGEFAQTVVATEAPIPSAGQFGIAKFSHFNTAPSPGTLYEIRSFRNAPVTDIAAGAFHSLARDANGALWVFGSNRCGQLGLDYAYESQNVALPRQLTLSRVCKKDQLPVVTRVYAGGDTSFCGIKTVNADEYHSSSSSERKKLLQNTAEVVYSFGDGLKGQLGNATFRHVQAEMVPVKEINYASEWSEKLSKVVPIQVNYLSAGPYHVAAVLDNANDLAKTQDLYLWGGNEFSQIGNGKRNNIPKPAHLVTKSATETDPYTQLMTKVKVNGVEVRQEIAAGDGTTCVYYKRM